MRSFLYLTLAATVAIIGCNQNEAPPETKTNVKVVAPFVRIDTQTHGADFTPSRPAAEAPPQTKQTNIAPCPLKRTCGTVTTKPVKRNCERSVLVKSTCRSTGQIAKTCRNFGKTSTCQRRCNTRCNRGFSLRLF